MAKVKIDDKVICLSGDIDRQKGKGSTAMVKGFATFSQYHPREVSLYDVGGNWLGWFWASAVVSVDVVWC